MPKNSGTIDVEVRVKEKAWPLLESDMRWQAKCRHCDLVVSDLQTENGAEAVARAHSVIQGHDVEFTWSVIDQPGGVIRASDPRD